MKKGEIFTVPTGEKYHFWKESEGQKYLILGKYSALPMIIAKSIGRPRLAAGPVVPVQDGAHQRADQRVGGDPDQEGIYQNIQLYRASS